MALLSIWKENATEVSREVTTKVVYQDFSFLYFIILLVAFTAIITFGIILTLKILDTLEEKRKYYEKLNSQSGSSAKVGR